MSFVLNQLLLALLARRPYPEPLHEPNSSSVLQPIAVNTCCGHWAIRVRVKLQVCDDAGAAATEGQHINGDPQAANGQCPSSRGSGGRCAHGCAAVTRRRLCCQRPGNRTSRSARQLNSAVLPATTGPRAIFMRSTAPALDSMRCRGHTVPPQQAADDHLVRDDQRCGKRSMPTQATSDTWARRISCSSRRMISSGLMHWNALVAVSRYKSRSAFQLCCRRYCRVAEAHCFSNDERQSTVSSARKAVRLSC